ncbi:MAG TPA: VF530 family protein [Candidatus Eisenbacteria bacterium]
MSQPGNPLHGITLERMVTELVAVHGWEELGRRIRIRCFTSDPSVASSLSFLRKNPWAREKVENLYRRTVLPRPRPRPGTIAPTRRE